MNEQPSQFIFSPCLCSGVLVRAGVFFFVCATVQDRECVYSKCYPTRCPSRTFALQLCVRNWNGSRCSTQTTFFWFPHLSFILHVCWYWRGCAWEVLLNEVDKCVEVGSTRNGSVFVAFFVKRLKETHSGFQPEEIPRMGEIGRPRGRKSQELRGIKEGWQPLPYSNNGSLVKKAKEIADR